MNFLAKSKPGITKNIVRIPKYLKKIGDVEGNVHKADQSIQDCEERFEALKGKNPQTGAEIGKNLMEMRGLIGKTAYDRFLYALFPNAIESKKANKVLKKIDPNLNSYDVLEGLSYVTADVGALSYDALVAKYPLLKTEMEAFLDEFGGESDFNCYCSKRSWTAPKRSFPKASTDNLKDA